MPVVSPFFDIKTRSLFEGLVGSPFETDWKKETDNPLLHKLIRSTQNIYYLYKMEEGKHYFPDNRLEEILGMKEGALNPLDIKALEMIMHPDDIALHFHSIKTLSTLSDEEIHESEFRFRSMDGSWKWFHTKEMIYQRDQEGKVESFFGVGWEITEMKKTEEKIRKSRSRLLAVLESTSESIFSFDHDLCIINFNSSAYKKLKAHNQIGA